MGEIIEVRLSDQQHRQLMDEARAAGQKFFDYCRTKLIGGQAGAAAFSPPPKCLEYYDAPKAPQPSKVEADNRIDRLEAMMLEMHQTIQNLANPAYVVETQQPEPQAPIDVDSIVNARFHQAEAAGLTEHVPDENEEVMRHAGVRPLSRRPMRYSAGSAPRHLQQL